MTLTFQGNHGEDVKELYYYLDSTPCHSYMKALYKYPQAAFPYDELVQESARRDRKQDEYEIEDTGTIIVLASRASGCLLDTQTLKKASLSAPKLFCY